MNKRYTLIPSSKLFLPSIKICECDDNKNNDINICKTLKCGYSFQEAKQELINKISYIINRINECETIEDINFLFNE